MELLHGIMGINMRVCLSILKCMGKEVLHGVMEIGILEGIPTGSGMDSEFFSGVMGELTKVTGMKGNLNQFNTWIIILFNAIILVIALYSYQI